MTNIKEYVRIFLNLGGGIIKTFFMVLKKYNIKFKAFLLFFIIISLITSFSIIYSQFVLGEITQASYSFNTNQIITLLLVLSAFIVTRALSAAISALYLARFEADALYNLRKYFVKYFLTQPFHKFEKENSGENLSVFSRDLPQAATFISSGGLRMVSDFMLLIVSIFFMFSINWIYSLIFFALFPILAISQIFIAIPISKANIKMSKAIAKFNSSINDSFQNISILKSYSLENILENKSFELYKNLVEISKRFAKIMSILVLSGIIVSLIPLFFINSFSAISVVNSSMDMATFIAFVSIASIASDWLLMLSQSLSNVKVSQAGATRLNDTLKDDMIDISEINPIEQKEPLISFSNVSFKYKEDGNLILDNINFEIKKGEKVAFIGQSGSGKSTILKLLLDLYKCENGKIKIFGHDSCDLNSESIRNCFSYVPQNSFLFPESISENITEKKYSDLSSLELERLEQATKASGIFSFISKLPEKYNSILNEGAENISGGQKQRIALARAFYKDSDIILFDEATSSLDSETESEIFESLKAISKNKTLIMVAHRESAIDFCDRTIHLDGGKINE